MDSHFGFIGGAPATLERAHGAVVMDGAKFDLLATGMKKPQNLDEILDQLANLDTDKTNYDLHKIPFEEWADYENLHLFVPQEV